MFNGPTDEEKQYIVLHPSSQETSIDFGTRGSINIAVQCGKMYNMKYVLYANKRKYLVPLVSAYTLRTKASWGLKYV